VGLRSFVQMTVMSMMKWMYKKSTWCKMLKTSNGIGWVFSLRVSNVKESTRGCGMEMSPCLYIKGIK
jgi:hypothetical protein